MCKKPSLRRSAILQTVNVINSPAMIRCLSQYTRGMGTQPERRPRLLIYSKSCTWHQELAKSVL